MARNQDNNNQDNNNQDNNQKKCAVLLVDGESGGVGKSTATRLLIEFYKKHSEFKLYDLDVNKLDVGKIYDPDRHKALVATGEDNSKPLISELIRFSDDEYTSSKVDVIFEDGLQTNVIANLPSNVKLQLDSWINENGLIKLATDEHIQLVKFFVCSPQNLSCDLFLQTVELYKNDQGMQHVLAFNEGHGITWDEAKIKQKLFQEIVDTYKIPVWIIPKLNPGYYEKILNNHLTFEGATQKENGIQMIGRQAIRVFIDKAHKSLASTLVSLGGSTLEVANKYYASGGQ